MRILRILFAYWKWFAKQLSIVQTFIILTVLYSLVIGITSMIVRLLRRDLLDRRLHDRPTSWHPRQDMPTTIESYRHQF
ncbi:MAG: hypothetical protein HY710_15305 [Candidatus Latescibacteria bacterium]|nr:hypothetical protein [Candidatus Latescibacterota bacterium]